MPATSSATSLLLRLSKGSTDEVIISVKLINKVVALFPLLFFDADCTLAVRLPARGSAESLYGIARPFAIAPPAPFSRLRSGNALAVIGSTCVFSCAAYAAGFGGVAGAGDSNSGIGARPQTGRRFLSRQLRRLERLLQEAGRKFRPDKINLRRQDHAAAGLRDRDSSLRRKTWHSSINIRPSRGGWQPAAGSTTARRTGWLARARRFVHIDGGLHPPKWPAISNRYLLLTNLSRRRATLKSTPFWTT